MSESNQGQDRGTNVSSNNTDNSGDANGNSIPPSSNAASTALNNSTEQTRNITVSIQYSYFTPERLAQLSNTSNNGNIENSSANSTNTIANGAGPSFGIGNGGHQPDGALVLSFRDVPASTPQDRLNSFISVAAQLAMERFNRLLNRPKGITKDDFDKLPILKVSDLPKSEGSLCSICYDEYEEEKDLNTTKRRRESEGEEESGKLKKRRDNKGMPTAGTSAAIAEQSSTALADQPHAPNDEETNPSYKHSPIKLPCGHIFGRECIYKWSKLENSCPLCRHKISESAGIQNTAQQDTDEVAANEAAFERIRRVLYDPAARNNNTENTNPSESSTNTIAPTIGNANNGEQLLSRTGFFLMPQNGQSLHNPVHSPPNNSGADIFNGSNSTVQNPPSIPGSSSNNQGPRWVPIPLTLFQFNSPNRSVSTPDSSADPSTVNEATSNGSVSASTDPQHNRLRAVLDHIFNVAQGGTSESLGTATPREQIARNQGANDTPSFDATQGTSFLENISGPTGYYRNGSRENDNNNNSNNNSNSGQERNENVISSSNDGNSLFSSGVASYRDQNGDVTTVELHNNNFSSASTDGHPSQGQGSSSTDTTAHSNTPNDNNEQSPN
ncbi:hypothetical protein SKDZ_04G3590 [Saccharomyces kudriavzevii ZP591]|nr:hypothetical protein SKDZ_04G3590 [Saccharomyces kudriavzevii ZP591]